MPGKRILLVEDEAIVREPIAALLAANGYEVSTAPDETGAISAVRSARPDLILLDIHLTRGSGIHALERIRANERSKEVPVIMLTGDRDRDTVLRCAVAGANDYYLKREFQMEELLHRIARCLQVPSPEGQAPSQVAPGSATRDAGVVEGEWDLGVLFSQTPAARDAMRAHGSSPGATRALRESIDREILLASALAAHAGVEGTDRAMAELGIEATRFFVLAFALSAELVRRPGSPVDRVALFAHSLYASIAAGLLASDAMGTPPHEASLAAFLHDVGLLLFDETSRDGLAHAARMADTGGVAIHEVERSLLGTDHGRAGAAACEAWGLSASACAAIAAHHCPWPEVQAPPGDLRTIALVRLGDLLARATGHAALCDRLSPCEDEVAALGAPRLDADRIVRDAKAAFDALLPVYLGSGAGEARTPPRGTVLRSIGIVCPEALAIDPVALVLGGRGGAAVRQAADIDAVPLERMEGLVLSLCRSADLPRAELWMRKAEEARVPNRVCILPAEAKGEDRAALARPGWRVLSWPVSRGGLLDALDARP